eukprot:12347724-Ditylum_brightwellii.AAC.1
MRSSIGLRESKNGRLTTSSKEPNNKLNEMKTEPYEMKEHHKPREMFKMPETEQKQAMLTLSSILSLLKHTGVENAR